MKAGSLFSGIGGIDLAFSLAGFDIRWQVEINDFCRKVLRKHRDNYWPNAKIFTDVRRVGQRQLEPVSIIFGGFPCQNISGAGQRAGIQHGNPSGLWFEFARIISELRPRAVLLENVARIASPRKEEDGTPSEADMAVVISALSDMGYDARWGIIAAADAGAPHERKRWFCLAYRNGGRYQLSPTARKRACHKKRHTQNRQRTQVSRPVIPNHHLLRAKKRLAHTNLQRCSQDRTSRTKKRKRIICTSQMGNAKSNGLERNRPFRKQILRTRYCKTQPKRANKAGWRRRRTQPRMGRIAPRIPRWMDRYNEGVNDAKKRKANTCKALRELWGEVRTSSLQRQIRRLKRIQAQEVLRTKMQSFGETTRESIRGNSEEKIFSSQRDNLRNMRDRPEPTGTSSKRRHYRQLTLELNDFMQFVPYEMALGEWESNKTPIYTLQGLRRGISEIKGGVLPETLSEVQEIWQSLSNEEKERVKLCACQCKQLNRNHHTPLDGDRLMDHQWPALPGQAQFDYEPPRLCDRNAPYRKERVEALGNAVVPQVVYPIAVKIKEFLEAI